MNYKKISYFICVSIITGPLFFPSSSLAKKVKAVKVVRGDGAHQEFTTTAKKILSSHGSKVGFSLRDSEGHEVFEINGNQSMMPASIAKSVSTECSLRTLGPQFQFETLFGYTGKVEGDTLNGDLVIQGSGDPSLVIEGIREVVEKLRFVYGIKKINGNLIFDNSYTGVKSLKIANGFEGDEGRSFAVDITPTSFNQNSFSVWVVADPRDRSKSIATNLPAQVLDLKIFNKSKGASSTEISLSYSLDKGEATVSGTIAKDGEPKGIYRAVEDPYDYALKILHRLWIDSGGEWKSPSIKVSTIVVDSKLLWKQSSKPLSQVMADVNKLSLNLGAELILLAAGAEKFGRPASYEKSLKLLKDCLSDYQIPDGGITMNNGSGLSREARIKPSALSQYLHKALHGKFAAEYQSSFGILGVDGTSKTRLKNFAGRARLKTGSLKDVRSLAGFLIDKDQEVYSFAMIQNSVDPNVAKNLEDQILNLFLENY